MTVDDGSEYKWELAGYTPATIPGARLVEYMQQLAKLFGHEASVHFVRIEEGSARVVGKVDRGVVAGKVYARVNEVRRGAGAADARAAFQAINTMLAEDDTAAALRRGSAVILRFPGAKPAAERPIEVNDSGSVVGYLYSLAQVKGGYHARLRLDEGTMLQCAVSDEMARLMRQSLFEMVRVHGRGRWKRQADGEWKAVELTITDVTKLKDASLRAVVDQLRALDIEWPGDPLGQWAELNEGNGHIQ